MLLPSSLSFCIDSVHGWEDTTVTIDGNAFALIARHARFSTPRYIEVVLSSSSMDAVKKIEQK